MSSSQLQNDVDVAIKMLLSVKNQRPGTEVSLPEELITKIVKASRDVFLSQPMLLEINSPVNICGDTHGQYADMLHLFDMGGFPPESNYLFLGDYVDRAKQSIEVITLALCYKLKYPECFFLLRGNHECASLNRIYGFYDECKRRYTVKLWRIFADCFMCMPVAAVVSDRILCMHGGLSPDLVNLSVINEIKRPCDVPDEGLLCDLLWSDPEAAMPGWGYSARGVSFTFGYDVIAEFLVENKLDLICRAHQVVEDGYEFQADRKLVTIFSAPNYCGEFDNAGAMMCVDINLKCSFKILRPTSHRSRIERMQKIMSQGGIGQHPGLNTARSSNSHRDWDMSEIIDEDNYDTKGKREENDKDNVLGTQEGVGAIGDINGSPVYNGIGGVGISVEMEKVNGGSQ